MAIEWLLSGYCVAIEWLQPGHDEKRYYAQAGKEHIVLEVASGLPQCVHPRLQLNVDSESSYSLNCH